MISNPNSLSLQYRFLTALLIAALGLGVSQCVAGQTAAPAGPPPGTIGWGLGSSVVVGGTSASARSLQSATLPAATGAKQEKETKDATGLNQGIKMHGHWVIDVKNPDGTLAQHQEFENSVQYDGQQLLTALLSGYGVMGGWEIYFTAQSGGTSPCTAATYPFCVIVESTTAQPGLFACGIYTCVPGLTVTPTFGVGPSVKLAGAITAPGAGTIGLVATGFAACNNVNGDSLGTPSTLATSSPSSCVKATTEAFGGTGTSTSITPISVAAGQIIQVTVTLTFS